MATVLGAILGWILAHLILWLYFLFVDWTRSKRYFEALNNGTLITSEKINTDFQVTFAAGMDITRASMVQ